jgi:hypothetical protein
MHAPLGARLSVGERMQRSPATRELGEAVRAIESVLSVIETAGREVDEWEAAWLWLAVRALCPNMYATALRYAKKAGLPYGRCRMRPPPVRTDLGERSIAALRRALAATFGPGSPA